MSSTYLRRRIPAVLPMVIKPVRGREGGFGGMERERDQER